MPRSRNTNKKATKRDAFRSLSPQEQVGSALARIGVKELERRHREGYTKKPVKKGEFDIWQDEQVWGEQGPPLLPLSP